MMTGRASPTVTVPMRTARRDPTPARSSSTMSRLLLLPPPPPDAWPAGGARTRGALLRPAPASRRPGKGEVAPVAGSADHGAEELSIRHPVQWPSEMREQPLVCLVTGATGGIGLATAE